MDITQAKALVESTLYPLIIPEYEAEPQVAPLLADVLPWDDRFMYGEKIQSLTDVGEPDEVGFGQELPDRSFADGYSVLAKTHKIGHKITFPLEMLRAADAADRIADFVSSQFVGQGRRFVQYQEKWVANTIQKGTLTAGSAKYYDNSFVNEADPYPKFIYDGLPFFDTAHVLKHSGTTPSNHTAVAALSQATIEAALTLMERTSALDERGEPIVNTMDTLLIPAGSLEFTASVLLNTTLKTGSANNDINPIQGRLNVVPWRFLGDDADQWYLWRTAPGRKPLRMRDSGTPVIQVLEDLSKGLMTVQAYKYFNLTVQDWRGAFNANKAAA